MPVDALGSLNALYVYEAKMTFLLRLSEYRAGVDRLIESRIFPVLSSFEALGATPSPPGDQSSEPTICHL